MAGMSAPTLALGKRTALGPSAMATVARRPLAQGLRVARHGDRHAGHQLEDREVPHAVVAGAVGTGDAGPVEHEGDRQPVHADVEQHLVEGPVEEGRVDRDDRVQAGQREAGGGGDGVLLGDADVEDPVGVGRGELRRARPAASMAAVMATTSSRSSPMRAISSAKTLVQVGPPASTGSPGHGVDDVDRVEPVGLVVLGRGVAETLGGQAVHDDRPAELTRGAERLLERERVVAVDRADVLEAEVLEHHLRLEQVLEALLGAVQRFVQRGADHRGARAASA